MNDRWAAYNKTDAGKEELRTRGRQLSVPMRTVLLMVDGQRSEEELREVIAAVRAPQDTLERLRRLGLVTGGALPGASVAQPSESVGTEDAVQRFQHLYSEMTRLVSEHLGLRGYLLLLKLERCSTAQELLAFRDDLHLALSKSFGSDVASVLLDRLDTA